MRKTILALLALIAVHWVADAAAGSLSLTVNVGASPTRLKPIGGVNGLPHAESGTAADSQDYHDARIDMVRIHNAGAGDIDDVFSVRGRPAAAPVPRVLRPQMLLNVNSIFLDPNADPDDPASYNFGPTDKLISQIRETGAEPLFRLGRSAGAEADVPALIGHYAKVAAHIVLHYNQGWDGGFRYGIKYWEVWNEPDFSGFWAAQPAAYYELYAEVAKAVKAADPTVLVGGPAQGRPLGVRPYGEDFLAYVRDHKLPLDFYSWHWYSDNNDPYDMVRVGQIIRERLDKFGFMTTPSIADDWDSSHGPLDAIETGTAQHAAYIGAALAYMQQAPVDLAMFDDAQRIFGAQRTPEAKALIAWGRMKDSPALLAVSGTRTDGFVAVAGKSEDGKLVQVFVSNYQAPARFRTPSLIDAPMIWLPNEGRFLSLSRQNFRPHDDHGYVLTVKGLKPGAHVVKRYRIDATKTFDLVETTSVSGSRVLLHSDLAPSGIELVQVSDSP
jgi:xylan 1,4-beta-xylosidase